MRSKLPLIVALVLGVISFAGIGKYMSDLVKKNTIIYDTVLITTKKVAAGELLTPDKIGEKKLPKDVVQQMVGVYKPSEKSLIVGRKVSKDMNAEEPLYRVTLEATNLRAEGKRFVRLLQRGERAISLPLESAGSIGDFVEPGDRVDLLANMEVPKTVVRTVSIPNQGIQEIPETTYTPSTLFLLENVRVLAVGNAYIDPDSPIGMSETVGLASGSTITIAVTPREAQVLTFAMRNGSARSGGAGAGRGMAVTFTLLLRPVGDSTTMADLGKRQSVVYEDFLDLTKIEEIQKERNLRVPKEAAGSGE